MGLDISIWVTNESDVFTPEYFEDEVIDSFHRHNLSRTFCNLMCQKYAGSAQPALEQIGKITGIDIKPLYDMEKFWDEENVESQLSFASTEEEKQLIQAQIDADRESIIGNIDNVTNTIYNLIDKLSPLDKLPDLLERHYPDTIGIDDYFSDFKLDKGDGYIGNNFGQDLRNFKRFLEFAKTKGSTTVYFRYG